MSMHNPPALDETVKRLLDRLNTIAGTGDDGCWFVITLMRGKPALSRMKPAMWADMLREAEAYQLPGEPAPAGRIAAA